MQCRLIVFSWMEFYASVDMGTQGKWLAHVTNAWADRSNLSMFACVLERANDSTEHLFLKFSIFSRS